ncbi:MAG: choice-of-anchor D domain-containing protein [Bacteroidota bacterium]
MPCSATLRSAALALLCCLVAVPSQAQGPLLTLEYPGTGGPEFGGKVAGVPDTDGDGVGDLLIGTARGNDAYLFSGADGSLLFELTSPNGGFTSFGQAVAGLSDVNGDGRGDLLIGAYRENRAYVFSGADGSLLLELVSPNEEEEGQFGVSVAAVPDASGDGVEDLLVGAEREGDSIFSEGNVYLFSGADGALLLEIPSPGQMGNTFFGRSLKSIPDTNGDGRGDILVGYSRRVQLYSGADGSLLREFAEPTPRGFAGVPDVDGDGRGDVLISTRDDDDAFLFSGADGSELLRIAPPFALEGKSFSRVAGTPDIDGDGAGDLLITGGTEVYLFSGADGTLLRDLRSPNPEEEGGSFGRSLAPVSSGNGQVDLLVGASNANNGRGRAYLFRGEALATPLLARSPDELGFGEVLLGEEAEAQTVVVESVGNTAVTVTGIRLQGDGDGFRIVSDLTPPLTLEPGDNTSFEVVFDPVALGLAEATLVIEAGAASRNVALEGQGVGSSAVFLVTKAEDTDDGACDADCSLREAIAAANALGSAASDTVRFDPALAGQTIAFAPGNGALTITEELVIDGDGLGITVDAKRRDRVFFVDRTSDPIEAAFVGLTVTGGFTSGEGGGIGGDGSATILRCAVIGNESKGDGGGVSLEGGAAVTASTISGNVSGEDGGGIVGAYSLSHTTISGNRAANRGGGLMLSDEAFFASVTVTRNDAGVRGGGFYSPSAFNTGFFRSTILGNTAGGDPQASSADCGGSIFGFDAGSNFSLFGSGTTEDGDCSFGSSITVVSPDEAFTRVFDPLLADNGGPTQTHLLLAPGDDPARNPAVDLDGLLTNCDADQRGFPAPFDGDGDGNAACDLGAVELNAADLNPAVTLTLAPADSAVVIPASGGPVTFTATLTNTSAASVTTQAWAAAVLPDNGLRLPVFGPVTVTLAPGQTLSRTLVQTVPGAAPAGRYAYAGYVGDFAGLAVTDRDTFGGQKTANSISASGTAAGSDVWTVRDAATGLLVEAGDVWQGEGGVAAASSSVLPTAFGLSAAYPNPFRQQTEVALAVPVASEVRVSVFDVLGRRVAVLLAGEVEAGEHRVAFDGAGLPSGVYVVRAEAAGLAEAQRVTLVR